MKKYFSKCVIWFKQTELGKEIKTVVIKSVANAIVGSALIVLFYKAAPKEEGKKVLNAVTNAFGKYYEGRNEAYSKIITLWEKHEGHYDSLLKKKK